MVEVSVIPIQTYVGKMSIYFQGFTTEAAFSFVTGANRVKSSAHNGILRHKKVTMVHIAHYKNRKPT